MIGIMTADDFREIVLSLDGASEGAHMKHPDFRANGRIFASLKPGEREGVVKLSADEQAELVRTQPKTFAPAAGAWGRRIRSCRAPSAAACRRRSSSPRSPPPGAWAR